MFGKAKCRVVVSPVPKAGPGAPDTLMSRARLRLLRIDRCTDRRQVGEVLRPSGREFRRDQVRSGDEARLETAPRVNHTFDAPFPRRFKINAGHFGKDIEPVWIVSESKETSRLGEVFG